MLFMIKLSYLATCNWKVPDKYEQLSDVPQLLMFLHQIFASGVYDFQIYPRNKFPCWIYRRIWSTAGYKTKSISYYKNLVKIKGRCLRKQTICGLICSHSDGTRDWHKDGNEQQSVETFLWLSILIYYNAKSE